MEAQIIAGMVSFDWVTIAKRSASKSYFQLHCRAAETLKFARRYRDLFRTHFGIDGAHKRVELTVVSKVVLWH